jgi:hypothetical protein
MPIMWIPSTHRENMSKKGQNIDTFYKCVEKIDISHKWNIVRIKDEGATNLRSPAIC